MLVQEHVPKVKASGGCPGAASYINKLMCGFCSGRAPETVGSKQGPLAVHCRPVWGAEVRCDLIPRPLNQNLALASCPRLLRARRRGHRTVAHLCPAQLLLNSPA